MESTPSALHQVGQFEKKLFEKMNSTLFVTLIVMVNSEEKYWEEKKEEQIQPVPNMSGRPCNPDDTSVTTRDHFIDGVFDRSFQNLLLVGCEKESIALYVEKGEFGSAPIFSVIKISRKIGKNKHRFLIKFKKGNFSKDLFTSFTKSLYSKANLRKLRSTRLEIKEPSSYTY